MEAEASANDKVSSEQVLTLFALPEPKTVPQAVESILQQLVTQNIIYSRPPHRVLVQQAVDEQRKGYDVLQ